MFSLCQALYRQGEKRQVFSKKRSLTWSAYSFSGWGEKLRCEGRQRKIEFAAWIYVSGSAKQGLASRQIFIYKDNPFLLKDSCIVVLNELGYQIIARISFNYKTDGVLFEKISNMTLSLRKTLSTEKTEIAVKWTLKFYCVYAPIALLPQFCLPGQAASKAFFSQGKISCARRMEKGNEREQAACVPKSRVLRVWLQCEVHFSEASRGHVEGTRLQAGRFMKVN